MVTAVQQGAERGLLQVGEIDFSFGGRFCLCQHGKQHACENHRDRHNDEQLGECESSLQISLHPAEPQKLSDLYITKFKAVTVTRRGNHLASDFRAISALVYKA